VKKDFLYVVLASALPALGNFVAVALALRHLDADWLGRSYALLAFFYIAIDLFNFGSPRIFTIDRVRSKVSTLIFLDVVSAVGSTIVFASVTHFIAQRGLVAQPRFAYSLVIAPACFGLSHFSLGVLRLYGRSAVVCAVSTVSAFSRVAVVWLVVVNADLQPMLPDLLLLVEAGYGAMLLLTYLATVMSGNRHVGELDASTGGPGRFNPWTFAYLDFLKEHRKEILGSWYSNAVFSGAKHADIMLVTLVLGPSAAALYRGVKSVHNLAFNSGQAFALVVASRLGAAMSSLRSVRRAPVALGAAAGVVLVASVSWVALRVHLFPTASLGEPIRQFAFMFAAFLGAGVIFVCRICSLHVFSIDQQAFVRLSSLEAGASLILVTLLSYALGLVGATLGPVLAGSFVLSLSARLSTKPIAVSV
jgi:hypothetical protein